MTKTCHPPSDTTALPYPLGTEKYRGEDVGETDGKYLNSTAARRGEGGRRLPLLPHKYGFSRAVYERKRVEAREALAAPKLLKS